jgi:hypothetical protein
LAGAIAAFMRERETGLSTEDFSERADRRFDSRLRHLADQTESAHAPSRPRPSRNLPGIPLQSVAALSLVAASILLFWLRFSSVPSVSAREVLNRAERAEARRIAAINEPVIHQQFQVTRLANGLSPQSANLEIWHDPKSNRWRQETEEAAAVHGVANPKSVAAKSKSRKTVHADPPVVAELQQILKTNEMHQQPISVSAFAGWRSKLRSPEERVTETSLENGDKALTIATSAAQPLPRNAIVKAELVIRMQDLHPVQERLSVSEPDGFRSYEIRETSFEVVALGSLGASIFEQPVLPSPVALQASSPNRVLMSESLVEGLELEIALFHRLHQANACLGEEVQIVTGSSAKPEVRGVVATAERRQQLARLFAEFPDVAVVLQVAVGDEPAGSTETSETSRVPAAEAETQGDTGSSPIRDHLLAHFARLDLTPEARRARSIEFSNRVITQSESADLHAWALRRLAERFNTVSFEKLSPAAVAKFQSMALDHLRALSSNVGRCDEMLRPVLASLGNENTGNSTLINSATEGKNWPSRFMRVFESVTTADRLILGLFDGAGSNASVLESGSALLVGLPKIMEGIREAESQLSGLGSSSESQISAQPIHQRVP